MAPMVSHAIRLGLIEAWRYDQVETFESGLLFARTEGSSRARDEPRDRGGDPRRQAGQGRGQAEDDLLQLSGHGLVDLAAYEAYLAGKLKPYSCPTRDPAGAQGDREAAEDRLSPRHGCPCPSRVRFPARPLSAARPRHLLRLLPDRRGRPALRSRSRLLPRSLPRRRLLPRHPDRGDLLRCFDRPKPDRVARLLSEVEAARRRSDR